MEKSLHGAQLYLFILSSENWLIALHFVVRQNREKIRIISLGLFLFLVREKLLIKGIIFTFGKIRSDGKHFLDFG